MTSKLPTRHAGHAKGMVLLGKRLARDIDAALTTHVNGKAAYVSCVGASRGCLRLPGGFDEAVDIAESLGEVNHAIRHWFKTECARLKVEDSIVDAIQGHHDTRSAANYRHISVEVMSEAINRIKLPPGI